MTSEGILLKKGEELGQFNFGSTIVLMFETEKGKEFTVKEGAKVQLGELLLK